MMGKRDKRMKWLFAGLGAALTLTAMAAGITALCRRSPEENTDHIDGGVIKQVQADVPKVIESTEIVEFHAEISLTTNSSMLNVFRTQTNSKQTVLLKKQKQQLSQLKKRQLVSTKNVRLVLKLVSQHRLVKL